jgi:hypothetical protein
MSNQVSPDAACCVYATVAAWSLPFWPSLDVSHFTPLRSYRLLQSNLCRPGVQGLRANGQTASMPIPLHCFTSIVAASVSEWKLIHSLTLAATTPAQPKQAAEANE